MHHAEKGRAYIIRITCFTLNNLYPIILSVGRGPLLERRQNVKSDQTNYHPLRDTPCHWILRAKKRLFEASRVWMEKALADDKITQ